MWFIIELASYSLVLREGREGLRLHGSCLDYQDMYGCDATNGSVWTRAIIHKLEFGNYHSALNNNNNNHSKTATPITARRQQQQQQESNNNNNNSNSKKATTTTTTAKATTE